MSDSLTRHVIRYPHARTTTLQYLAKREEKTKQLMMEIGAAPKKPVPKPSSPSRISRTIYWIARIWGR